MSDDRHESISRRAYELWEKDGGNHGRHEDHWHQASREADEPSPTVLAPDGTTIGDDSGGVGTKPRRRSATKGVSKAEPADSPAAPPPTIASPEASAEPADTPVSVPATKTRKTKTK